MRCEQSCSQLVFEVYERVLSSKLTESTLGVVMAIETRVKNGIRAPEKFKFTFRPKEPDVIEE